MDISHNNLRKRFSDLCVSVKVNAAARHRLPAIYEDKETTWKFICPPMRIG